MQYRKHEHTNKHLHVHVQLNVVHIQVKHCTRARKSQTSTHERSTKKLYANVVHILVKIEKARVNVVHRHVHVQVHVHTVYILYTEGAQSIFVYMY